MVIEGELTLGSKHTMQHVDKILWSCTIKTNILLLANVSPINLTKNK